MNIKEKLSSLKSDITAVYVAMKSPDTPIMAKVLGGITVGYALSPIDLIPDFIPVLGYLDDLIILPLLIALTLKFIPPDVMTRSRDEARDLWKDGKPKKWYYALPIVCVWLLVLWLICKAVFKL